jgi:hypothetical protein
LDHNQFSGVFVSLGWFHHPNEIKTPENRIRAL